MFTLLSEAIAYVGMASILLAFLLETRDVLHSKEPVYLWLLAFGSGLLAVRAFLIRDWAFLVLEIVWCGAALAVLVAGGTSSPQNPIDPSS